MNQQVAHITTTEFAERAHVHVATVRRWVERGYLTPIQTTPGGHFRFDPEDVDRLLKRRDHARAS